MGSSPYYYFVDYEEDFESALHKLREREFKAGRYNPVMMLPEFPVDENAPAPGAKHDSIDEALEDAMEDGTRSILDLQMVGTMDDFRVARIFLSDEMLDYFGTDKPTAEQVMNCEELFSDTERGKGVCIPIYQDNLPVQLFFMGYSID